MFLNQRSPLNLRVKSKKAELFFLNKTNALDISTNFPIIWKQISRRSLFNYEQIKRLINKVKKIFYGTKKPKKIKINSKKSKVSKISDLSDYLDLNESELQSIPSLSEFNDFDSLNQEENDELIDDDSMLKTGKTLNTIKETTLKDEYSYYTSSSENNKNQNNDILNINDRISEKSNDDTNKINDKNSNQYTIVSNIDLDNENNSINSINNTNKITPYEESEINDEIYPNEVFFNGKNVNNKNNKKKGTKDLINKIKSDLKSPLNIKLNNSDMNIDDNEKKELNISICSTEISFTLYSEYENINELSDYKYSKDLKLRQKIRHFLKDDKESLFDSNFDFPSSSSLFNSDYEKKGKFKTKKESLIKYDGNRTLSKDESLNIIKYNHKKRQKTISSMKYEKRNQSPNLTKVPTLNIKNYSHFSDKLKGNFNIKKDNNNNKNKKIGILKAKKTLLDALNKNIERNQININNPDLFYSEYFHSILDKKKEKQGENYLNKEEEELMRNLKRKNSYSHKNSYTHKNSKNSKNSYSKRNSYCKKNSNKK